MKRVKITDLSFLLSFVLMCSLIMSPVVAAKQDNVFHYVALGDSLSIGYEPGLTIESIPYGYTERVYEQALYYGRTQYVNYGVGGLTSKGLSNYLIAMNDGKLVDPEDIQPGLNKIDPRLETRIKELAQVKSSIVSADLITISIGGNDFRELAFAVQENNNSSHVKESFNKKIEELAINLTESLDQIFSLNSTAKVVLTDQYQPYPYIQSFTSKQTYDDLNEYTEQIREQLLTIVDVYQLQGNNIQLAEVSKAFVDKEIMYTYIMRSDIHPNQRGYEAIAIVVSELIWGQYKQPTFRDPLSIIVGGTELDIADKPIVLNGRTFLPIREYAEQLGGVVIWDRSIRTTRIKLGDREVPFVIEGNLQSIEDSTADHSGDVVLFNSKTYVSLRAVTNGLGFDVIYIPKSKTVYINP